MTTQNVYYILGSNSFRHKMCSLPVGYGKRNGGVILLEWAQLSSIADFDCTARSQTDTV